MLNVAKVYYPESQCGCWGSILIYVRWFEGVGGPVEYLSD